MTSVIISDTHCNHRKIELPVGDLLIHSGDMTIDGTREEIEDFLDWYSGLNFKFKILIAGNHDFYVENKPHDFRNMLDKSIIYLENESVEIEGVQFFGSPYTYKYGEWAFQRPRSHEMEKIWKGIPQTTDVLITHGPPYGILDFANSRVHAGCEELNAAISFIRPKFHFFGHIHEAAGQRKSEGTTFINASQVDIMYNVVHEPVVVEID